MMVVGSWEDHELQWPAAASYQDFSGHYSYVFRAGKMMIAAGKTMSYTGQQRVAIRVPRVISPMCLGLERR